MTIGQKLKDLRKEQKLTIKELSKRSGVTTVSIIHYEADKSIPSLINTQKLATALKCSFDELYKLRNN